MKALTLYQPYATAIADCHKKFETRSWNTKYRGEIAIHAGAKLVPWPLSEATGDLICRLYPSGKMLPRGAVVCVADLYDVWTTEFITNLRQPIASADILLGDYSPGRFAFALRNVRKLKEPVEARGFQMLWTVPPDVEARVRAQL